MPPPLGFVLPHLAFVLPHLSFVSSTVAIVSPQLAFVSSHAAFASSPLAIVSSHVAFPSPPVADLAVHLSSLTMECGGAAIAFEPTEPPVHVAKGTRPERSRQLDDYYYRHGAEYY